MMKGGLTMKLKIRELSIKTGLSTHTINKWYAWKRQNPDNPLAKEIPDFEKPKYTSARLWDEEDVDKIIAFKSRVVMGRNGFMAITGKKGKISND
jgi:hypothetical protein